MSGIISKLLDFFFKKTPYSVLMVGLDGAGKTTILYKLKFDDDSLIIESTYGFNVEEIHCGSSYFTVWDLGGQNSIRKLWRFYYPEKEGIIFIIDSTDTERIQELKLQLNQLLNEKLLKTLPLLIFANKQDSIRALKVKCLINILQLDKIKCRSWKIQGCSAINGSGLKEGFEWLTKHLKN